MNLLIHADPGARSNFVAAFLSNSMTKVSFDTGIELKPKFFKIHNLSSKQTLQRFNGYKIRIQPLLSTIDLHTLLFLRKNVYSLIPDFTKNEYSLDTFTKLTVFAQEIFQKDKDTDYTLYDSVISFADTFDREKMIELYSKVNKNMPSYQMMKIMQQTNDKNRIDIDKNHACSMVRLCLERESQLGLQEQHRFWSIVDVYNTVATDQLYDTVNALINPDNYGIYLNQNTI